MWQGVQLSGPMTFKLKNELANGGTAQALFLPAAGQVGGDQGLIGGQGQI